MNELYKQTNKRYVNRIFEIAQKPKTKFIFFHFLFLIPSRPISSDPQKKQLLSLPFFLLFCFFFFGTLNFSHDTFKLDTTTIQSLKTNNQAF